MSAVPATAVAVFEKLSGQGVAASSYPAQKLEKVLASAQGAAYAGTMLHLQSCALDFAKACQRFTEGPQSLKQGLKEHYLHPNYLNHMAEAMPVLADGSRQLMPVYFHNARWPYQFARDAARAANPHAYEVQGAVAQLRRQQAGLLMQQRRAHKQAQGPSERWAAQQVAKNATLLAPYNALRAEMRRAALAEVKATQRPAKVVQLPERTRTQPLMQVANL